MKKYIYILSVAALSLTACESGYLETAPQNAEGTNRPRMLLWLSTVCAVL